jgi:hypothetical protein
VATTRNRVDCKPERQRSVSPLEELNAACRDWSRYWFEWVISPHSNDRDERVEREIDKVLAELTEEQRTQLDERIKKKREEAQESFRALSEKLIGACFDFNMNNQAEVIRKASISFPYSSKDMQEAFFATSLLSQRVNHELRKSSAAQEYKPKITLNGVRRRLLMMCSKGKPYSSTRQLARLIGCSSSTVTDAISSAARLKAWASKISGESNPSSPAVQSATESVTDRVSSDTEGDPADITPDDDAEVAFSRLLQEAPPGIRARLNAIDDPETRRQIGIFYDSNPELALEQLREQQVQEHSSRGNVMLGRKL